MSLILRVFMSFGVLFRIYDSVCSEATECHLWEEASRILMNEPSLNVTCQRDDICAGFSCLGSYLFQNEMFGVGEEFGFSVEFIPCSFPLYLRMRINSTDLRFTKFVKVQGRDEEAILLMMPEDSGPEEPFGKIHMTWSSVLIPVKYHVTLQATFIRLYSGGELPSITIIPAMTYPVPNCRYDPAVLSARTKSPVMKPEETSEIPMATNEYSFLFKMILGSSCAFVFLCLVFIVVVCRRRQKNRKHALDVVIDDNEDESEEKSSSSESSPRFTDDKQKLLKV